MDLSQEILPISNISSSSVSTSLITDTPVRQEYQLISTINASIRTPDGNVSDSQEQQVVSLDTSLDQTTDPIIQILNYLLNKLSQQG